MNIDVVKQKITPGKGFEQRIGMEFFSTPEPDTCGGRLTVDDRVMQPFGYLSGGATLALAETLAGMGSCALCPGMACVGMSISANHMRTATKGDVVTAIARILHQGTKTHVWTVEVTNQDGQLVSMATVTNMVMKIE